MAFGGGVEVSIQPRRIALLEHPAHLLGASRQPSLYVVASRKGELSLLDEQFNLRPPVRRLPPISDLCLAATGGLASIITSEPKALLIQHLDSGSVLKEFADSSWECCRFDSDGARLWCAARRDSSQLECRLLDLTSLQIVARCVIPDDFGDSGCLFTPMPQADVAALWLADGQGDSQLLWLTHASGEIKWKREPLVDGAYPPVFSDSGAEFLLNTGNAVHRYGHPAGQLLGTCRCLLEEQAFEPSLCFLDRNTALVRTSNGRLFKIDLETMSLGEEIIISQHEPRPTRYYYPRLEGDTELCTDILVFHRLGNYVVLTCQRGENSIGPLCNDSLLLCHREQFTRSQQNS